MRFLITNDDGIHAAGIRALVKAALNRGHEPLVCAPNSQCSANSQHITLNRPLLVYPQMLENVQAYAVDGTPSDCARLGLQLFEKPIDACISGINIGENVGASIYYSGTVSAARDGAMLNLPAIASSLAFGGTEEGMQKLADFTIQTAEKCRSISFPRCGVLNINAPKYDPSEWKKPIFCPVSTAYFKDCYVRRESPLGQMYFWLGTEGAKEDTLLMEPHLPGTDVVLLKEGHITLSMLGEIQTHNENLDQVLMD